MGGRAAAERIPGIWNKQNLTYTRQTFLIAMFLIIMEKAS